MARAVPRASAFGRLALCAAKTRSFGRVDRHRGRIDRHAILVTRGFDRDVVVENVIQHLRSLPIVELAPAAAAGAFEQELLVLVERMAG
jgi:hypothetical protein